MTTKQKKKLCWNCDGRVAMEDENCPFCGVYISSLNAGEQEKEGLFAPPYRVETEEEQPVHSAPYAKEEVQEEVQETAARGSSESTQPLLSSDIKAAVLPLMLLLAGSVSLLFGIALMLFSEHGVLTLHWSGSYWFVYFILSFPMLFLGWRFLQQIEEK